MENNPHYEFPDDEGNFEDELNDPHANTGDDSPVQISYNAAALNSAQRNRSNSLDNTGYEDDHGVPVSIKNRIFRGSFLPAMLLLQRGQIDVHQVWEPTVGSQLIHFVAHFGKIKPMRAIVEVFHADVNSRDYRSITPMHSAAIGGEIATLSYLASCPGIELNVKDNAGLTPLLYAVSNNHVACFAYLAFEKGADLKVKDVNGCGVLHWAVYSGSIDILRLIRNTHLINDLNLKDNI